MISHQFYQTRHDVDQWMRLAASTLAHQSQAASLVTAPHPVRARFKHLELISTRGRQVLMVLVMMGGEIRQRLLVMDEPVSQEQLSGTAEQITNHYHSRHVDEIVASRGQAYGLEADVLRWIIDELQQAEALVACEVYMDGLTNVLAQPEFAGSEDARRALRMLEERSLLQDLLSRTVLSDNTSSIQVLIGGEGTWEDLRQCSIVLGKYGSPGLTTGTLGVLGPMRMSYGHTISLVRFLSGLLTEMVSGALLDENSD
jgi:heat-inducible transcriptional repressor